jgi:hypothetical protein
MVFVLLWWVFSLPLFFVLLCFGGVSGADGWWVGGGGPVWVWWVAESERSVWESEEEVGELC